MAAKDLKWVTDGWPYVSGQVSVRRVRGSDNRIKIQMRVDLGVLQMETFGRPDGSRPYDHESLLEYHRDRLEASRRANGNDLGFALDSDECRDLREEAFQYYQRYLANFVLEDYEAVARDTRRNIEVLDLCRTYARDDEDRYSLEAYRPYIVMMNSQSQALGAMRLGSYRTALKHVEAGMRAIRDFFRRARQPKAFRESSEVEVLRTLRKEILRRLPVDPTRVVRRKLKKAIEQERYEDAARYRDQLEALLGHDRPSVE
ncbi:MAG: UvrB/UvrC motif-containing protein [Phycisphaerae bacterium]|nr:UvrB/UvrC motif-containing protein [Phycisphaerae bacterium]